VVSGAQANNRGSLSNNTVIGNAIKGIDNNGSDAVDPSGVIYVPAFSAATVGVIPTIRTNPGSGGIYVYVYRNAKCDGENTTAGIGPNNIALSMILEGGGVYCVNN
jgi:hypothetical protein